MKSKFAPCRVQIIATFAGKQRGISIANTGYGTRRHADRWIARGADNVTVYVNSNSTGRQIARDEYFSPATEAKFAETKRLCAEFGCSRIINGMPFFSTPPAFYDPITDDFGNLQFVVLSGDRAREFYGFTGIGNRGFAEI